MVTFGVCSWSVMIVCGIFDPVARAENCSLVSLSVVAGLL